MTLKQACYRLTVARKKAVSTKVEITELNKIIKRLGGHPDEKKKRRRNREIFRQYQEGTSYAAIAHAFKLSPSGVRMICRQIEFVNKRESESFRA